MSAVAVHPGTPHSLHVRRDVEAPRAFQEEAVVRVLQAGVCATDVEIDQGLFGETPGGCDYLVLGHENVGRVEWCPAGGALAAGDLVVCTVRRGCAERCPACAEGRSDLCFTGHFSERGIRRRHGFMSELYGEDPRYLVHVPAHLRAGAVLMEPLSIVEKGIEQALYLYERFTWRPRTAVVVGAGPVGLLAALVLRLRGLSVNVAALEPQGSPRDLLLREAGIRYFSTALGAVEELPAQVGRVDVVFEATGATAAVVPAMNLLGPNGVCVLSSVTAGHRALPVDVAAWNQDMVLGNRVVFGTVNAGRAHFEAGVRDMEAAEARFPGWLGRLITRRVPFTDAAGAITHRPDDIKTVLEFAG
jgi:glucose 1-dehydrogenase